MRQSLRSTKVSKGTSLFTTVSARIKASANNCDEKLARMVKMGLKTA